MTNLFAVESPLQALCAVEVALGKQYEKNDIIVHLSSEPASLKNNNQILKIVGLYNWNEVHVHQIKHYNNLTLRTYETVRFLRNIEKQYKRSINTLYIGDFLYQFMHFIRCAVDAPETFLLDDGVGTITSINKYLKHGLYYPKDRVKGSNNPLKRYANKIIYRHYQKESILNKKLKVLTAFYDSDKNYGIEKLEFKNIQSLRKQKSVIQDSIVYYYGSPYSEAKIISLEYELAFLSKVYNYYLSKEKKLIYFPHRSDSDEKINYIYAIIGIEIGKSDDMAEYNLLTTTVLPCEVSGAVTSTLNNVKILLPNVPLRSFLLDKNEVSSKRSQAIFDVYKHYKALGIEVQESK